MASKKYKNLRITVILLFVFLVFTKIDFRTSEPHPWSSHDDASYYFHAYTVGLDFDLDYTNQVSKDSNFSKLNKSDNPVPTHPFGAGFLASPFVFVGKIFSNLFSEMLHENNNIIYFFYSLSAITYFFLTVLLIDKTLNNLEIKKISSINLLLLLSGSGLAYFAFERFSMTPVYEAFAVSLVIYISTLNNKKQFYFVGLFSILFLAIRWVNYYFILLPFLTRILMGKKSNLKYLLYKNYYYFLGILTGASLFLYHTFLLYGFTSFNPSRVNNYAGPAVNLIDKFLFFSDLQSLYSIQALLSILNDFLLILFSQEFGLAWFSPVLFSIFYVIIKIVYKKQIKLFIVLSTMIFVPLGIVILWQSVASSYGYRYLYSLIPVAIVLSCKYLSQNEFKILNVLNIFSLFLYFTFETDELNSLSEQVNTFGVNTMYSARYYIEGSFNSISNLETYLIIFGSSFVSVIFIKVCLLVFDSDSLVELIERFGYLNEDVVRLIDYSNYVSLFELLFLISLFLYFIYKILNQPSNRNYRKVE